MAGEIPLGIAVQVSGANDLDSLDQKLKKVGQTKDQLDFQFTKPVGGQGDFGFADSFKKASSAQEEYRKQLSATAQSTGILQRAWQGFASIFSPFRSQAQGVSEGAKGITEEFGRSTKATTALREAFHVVNPILASTGTSMVGLGAFAGLARAGVAGLAIGLAGAFITSLEAAGDKLEKMRKSLQSLYGQQGGDALVSSVKKTADAIRSSWDGAAQAVNAYVSARNRAQNAPPLEAGETLVGPYMLTAPTAGQTAAPPGSVTAPGAGGQSAAATLAERQLRTISELEQMAGANASDAQQKIKDFFSTIDQRGRVSAETFKAIRDQLPELAKLLADAYGRGADTITRMDDLQLRLTDHVDKFGNTVKGEVLALNQVDSAISNNQASADKLYQSFKPNLSQSVDHLRDSVVKLWQDMGKGQSAVSGFLDSVAKGIDKARQAAENARRYTAGLGAAGWEGAAGDFAAKELAGGAGTGENLPSNFKKVGDDLGAAFKTVEQSATSTTQDLQPLSPAIDATGTSASTATPAVSELATSTGDLATSAAAGIAAVNQLKDAIANGWRMPAQQTGLGLSGTGSTPSFTLDTGQNVQGVAGYATGGAFIVGGSGGTDTTPVKFMATPGEIVTVTPAGLEAPSGLGRSMSPASGLSSTGAAATAQSAAAPVSAITTPITSAIYDMNKSLGASIDTSGAQTRDTLRTLLGGAAGINQPTGGMAAIAAAGAHRAPGQPAFATQHPVNIINMPAAQPTASGGAATSSTAGGLHPFWSHGNVYGWNPYNLTQPYYQVKGFGPVIDVWGSTPPDGTPAPEYAMKFAEGGSFEVGGPAVGQDKTQVKFYATRGERVDITPANQNQRPFGNSKKLNDNRVINVHVYGVPTPQAFAASSGAIKRALRRAAGSAA